MLKTLIASALIIVPLISTAQRYLVVKKRVKTVLVFEAGDHIKFKVKGENHWRKQLINGFTDHAIRFHYFDIDLNDIEAIKKPPHEMKNGIPNSLIFAGGAYLVIDQFNQTVVRGEPFDVYSSTVAVSAALVGSGLIWKILKRKKYKIDGQKFRVETSDYIP